MDEDGYKIKTINKKKKNGSDMVNQLQQVSSTKCSSKIYEQTNKETDKKTRVRKEIKDLVTII